MNQRPQKLLDQVRDAIRVKQYSPRTEEAYVEWITRYILFHNKRHPSEMGVPEIEAFLTHLAVEHRVAASTQNQALHALLFLYRQVLKKELDGQINSVRAKKPQRLPTVLSRDQVFRLIGFLPAPYQLIAKLLYGSGLRLSECLQLRVKDVDFARCQITVHDGKGKKDRVTMLPTTLVPFLQDHLRHVKELHEDDLSQGYGSVPLPFALERKPVLNCGAGQDTPTPAENGPGSTFSLPTGYPKIPTRASFTATTSEQEAYKQRSSRRRGRPGLISGSARTPSAIASPPTCSKTATTSAPSRNSSATRLALSLPKGRQDDHDLHSCPPARRPSRAQPVGRCVTETEDTP